MKSSVAQNRSTDIAIAVFAALFSVAAVTGIVTTTQANIARLQTRHADSVVRTQTRLLSRIDVPAPLVQDVAQSEAVLPTVHIVAPYDTLTSLSAAYGVSVDAIADANGIRDPNVIYTGSALVIPVPTDSASD